MGNRIAISLVKKTRKVRVPEDDLLDATMEAMSSRDWELVVIQHEITLDRGCLVGTKFIALR